MDNDNTKKTTIEQAAANVEAALNADPAGRKIWAETLRRANFETDAFEQLVADVVSRRQNG